MSSKSTPQEESWYEYRRLILQSLQELKTDMGKVQDRLSNLEKFEDIKQDVDELVKNFNNFARTYEKEMTTVRVKQGMLYSAIAAGVSVLVTLAEKLI